MQSFLAFLANSSAKNNLRNRKLKRYKLSLHNSSQFVNFLVFVNQIRKYTVIYNEQVITMLKD